jgi:hypothetical protein
MKETIVRIRNKELSQSGISGEATDLGESFWKDLCTSFNLSVKGIGVNIFPDLGSFVLEKILFCSNQITFGRFFVFSIDLRLIKIETGYFWIRSGNSIVQSPFTDYIDKEYWTYNGDIYRELIVSFFTVYALFDLDSLWFPLMEYLDPELNKLGSAFAPHKCQAPPDLVQKTLFEIREEQLMDLSIRTRTIIHIDSEGYKERDKVQKTLYELIKEHKSREKIKPIKKEEELTLLQSYKRKREEEEEEEEEKEKEEDVSTEEIEETQEIDKEEEEEEPDPNSQRTSFSILKAVTSIGISKGIEFAEELIDPHSESNKSIYSFSGSVFNCSGVFSKHQIYSSVQSNLMWFLILAIVVAVVLTVVLNSYWPI